MSIKSMMSIPKTVLALACVMSVTHAFAQPEDTCFPMELTPESDMFLKRGEGVVTQLDMDAYLQTLPEHHRAEFLTDPGRIADVANNLVTKRQLLSAACAEGSINTDSSLLQAQLYDHAAEIVSRQYIQQRWQEAKLRDYSERALEIYLGNPERFRKNPTLEITVAYIQSGDLASETDGMRRILQIHEAALKTDFAVAAESMSDYSGTSDPKVTFTDVQRESLDPTVASMVDRLSVGEISPPFRAARGWYIVRLDKVNSGDIPEFEEVEKEAIEIARQRHKEGFEERLLRQVNSEPVSIAEGAVENLLSRYQQSKRDQQRLNEEIRGLMAGG